MLAFAGQVLMHGVLFACVHVASAVFTLAEGKVNHVGHDGQSYFRSVVFADSERHQGQSLFILQ